MVASELRVNDDYNRKFILLVEIKIKTFKEYVKRYVAAIKRKEMNTPYEANYLYIYKSLPFFFFGSSPFPIFRYQDVTFDIVRRCFKKKNQNMKKINAPLLVELRCFNGLHVLVL